MIFPSPILLLAGALAVTAAIGGSYIKGRHDGMEIQAADHARAVAVANDEARRLERARQSAADASARLAAAREAGIRADADRARNMAGGLRDDLRAANAYAAQSRAAAEQVAALATELLGRCHARYIGVAEAAARSDSEARELRQAWPSNPH